MKTYLIKFNIHGEPLAQIIADFPSESALHRFISIFYPDTNYDWELLKPGYIMTGYPE